MAKSRKPSLKVRHVIKKETQGLKDRNLFHTKSGKRLSEEIKKIKNHIFEANKITENEIANAIEKRDWKTAIWLALEEESIEIAAEKVGEILFELYKRECDASDFDKRVDQWIKYTKELFDAVFDKYEMDEPLPDELAFPLFDGARRARDKIVSEEFKLAMF